MNLLPHNPQLVATPDLSSEPAETGTSEPGQSLHVLLVEDAADDAVLILDALRSGGYEPLPKLVTSSPGMRGALADAKFDLILSDYRLPGFNAMEAFAVYREFGLDIPFLIVSGFIGEETAVAAMKAGVHDCINKNNLARLALAVRRELREAENRRERARVEAALQAAYAELAAIHANVPVLLLVVDEELRVHSANDLTSRLSGARSADIIGHPAGQAIGCANSLGNPLGCGQGSACPPCQIRLTALDTLTHGTRHENVEAIIPGQAPDGPNRYLLVSSALLNATPPRKALVCALDITQLKQTQVALELSRRELLDLNRHLDHKVSDLQNALNEKDVLFKEVQHRVKNNLQVISSLLSLQAHQSGSDPARNALAESRDRVRSMALIHEQLSFTGHVAEIEFGQYIDRLIQYLLSGYAACPERIRISTDVDVVLTLDQAMPCGLIVQELLSNSLKHAFPGGVSGEIRVEFHLVEGEYRLLYRDSGVGLPPGFDPKRTESLGTQLISDLSQQLRGRMECFSAGGANFHLTFPGRNK